MPYRSEFFEKYSENRYVLTIAIDLHSSIRRSYDRDTRNDIIDYKLLQEVIQNWKPAENNFDSYTYLIIQEVLREAEEYFKEYNIDIIKELL
jgi:hypothetical protein